ncbi:hypothetical protein BT63DRAFT_393282 [Microthyrium microscopicum]|uniref:PLD phosphodiesterase domain-containing protein n=1 Tax=Microthyrium microscopicum TaxID=703497 RepID=A0A6A6TZT9_9PEZI|nr:hypothetical protein BT63DRAFT_393282 [Microthyrium microscopicum]
MASTISDRVYHWCTQTPSISSEVAKDPTKSAATIGKELFGKHAVATGNENASEGSPSPRPSQGSRTPIHVVPTDNDLERALQCGNFGATRPSDLFLKVWHDALVTLDKDPLLGVVSPSLMGATGTLPLTIIGVIWDVCRHMSNLIVRAEKEVFFATNFWAASGATTLITDAIRELDRRAGQRQQRVVMKIMFDRGNPKQMLKNHLLMSPKEYTTDKLKIPDPSEIPNIDLEVMNYHRPMLGTFHSKFVVVDRKFGLVCSNNIMENENLEMMSHIEGPIVDSLYDTCMISWNNALKPPLPQLNTRAIDHGFPSFEDESYKAIFDEAGTVKKTPSTVGTAGQDQERLPAHNPGDPHYDTSIATEFVRMQSTLAPTATESHIDLVAKHLSISTHSDKKPTVSDPTSSEDYFNPFVLIPPHAPVPMALVNRKPVGHPTNSSVDVPQNAAWLSAVRNAKEKIFIQTPDLNAKPLLPELVKAVKRGVEVEYWVCLGYNDAGELLPGQGGTNEMIAKKISDDLRGEDEDTRRRFKVGWYTAKDQNRPIHKKEQGRTCHIKLLIADDQVGIQGNGNQDAQSWFHSQEVNLMVDSKTICTAWKDGIHRNQNTHLYGIGSPEDGIWRDKDGNQTKFAIGADPGHLAWAKGVIGAVQRVRGVGGF